MLSNELLLLVWLQVLIELWVAWLSTPLIRISRHQHINAAATRTPMNWRNEQTKNTRKSPLSHQLRSTESFERWWLLFRITHVFFPFDRKSNPGQWLDLRSRLYIGLFIVFIEYPLNLGSNCTYFNVFRKSDLWEHISDAILLFFFCKNCHFLGYKCVSIQNSTWILLRSAAA